MTDVAPHQPQWFRRRLYLFAVSGLCGFCILYLTIRGEDTRLAETIVTFAFIALMGFVGSYVFGAVWDDANVMRQKVKLAEIKNGNGKDH